MPTSTASAVWRGGLKTGSGDYEAGSGAFRGTYTAATRFEGAAGTNPEELIAAAHAACVNMALAAALEREGKPPTSISTTAFCTIEKGEDGFRITTMRLEMRGTVPGLDQVTFATAAEGAKENCPVSKALKGNVTFQLDAKLE